LNILLSPSDLIERLNSDEAIEEPKKEDPKVQKQQNKQQDQQADQLNKGKKTNKKNKKRNKNKPQENGLEPKEEKKLFEIRSLFNKNFRQMLEDNKNTKLLKIKPQEFYKRIVSLAKKRYNYDLPAELTELECRKSYKNKVAFLREFCIMIGLKMQSKDY
jgi:flagellar biosynthesis GTPase FlhF